jgi:hypothetical protein
MSHCSVVFYGSGSIDILRVVLVLALGRMLASLLFTNRLLAVLLRSVSGYSVGGLFLIEPAPDVAPVRFMVETSAKNTAAAQSRRLKLLRRIIGRD